MAPIAETKKVKHVRQAPDWIDKDIVAKLPKEKQSYWKNRMSGKNGNPDLTPKRKVIKTPSDIQVGFDNEGNMYAKTRTIRRAKQPTDNRYTKKQNKRKK